MEKLNIAIADDNERMVRLLGDIVRSDEELQVIGTAKDGVEAYELIKTAETRCCRRRSARRYPPFQTPRRPLLPFPYTAPRSLQRCTSCRSNRIPVSRTRRNSAAARCRTGIGSWSPVSAQALILSDKECFCFPRGTEALQHIFAGNSTLNAPLTDAEGDVGC